VTSLPGVWSLSWSLSFEGDSDSGYVGLSLVLYIELSMLVRGFGRCAVLAGRATATPPAMPVSNLDTDNCLQSS